MVIHFQVPVPTSSFQSSGISPCEFICNSLHHGFFPVFRQLPTHAESCNQQVTTATSASTATVSFLFSRVHTCSGFCRLYHGRPAPMQ